VVPVIAFLSIAMLALVAASCASRKFECAIAGVGISCNELSTKGEPSAPKEEASAENSELPSIKEPNE